MQKKFNSKGKQIISGKTKIGHVVSGGAMKSLHYQMGVGMCLEDKGFMYRGGLLDKPTEELLPRNPRGTNIIDMIIGLSAGSEYGIGPALGFSAEQMFELSGVWI